MTSLRQSAASLALVGLVVVFGLGVYDWLGVAGSVPLFFLPVLASAYWFGFWPAIAATLAGRALHFQRGVREPFQRTHACGRGL